MTHIKLMMLLFCFFSASFVFAGQYEDIVDKAFEAFDTDISESWSYTEISKRDDTVFVASHDPGRAEEDRWLLVSVDDRVPTEEETEKFLSEKLAGDEEDQEKDKDNSADAMIKPDTLELLEETVGYWMFGFVPSEDDEDEGFMNHIYGTMKVVKNGHYVEYMDLSNKAPFKPVTGVKIKKFRTRLVFAPATTGGAIVPKSVDFHVEGRAFLAIKIDETESVRYENYKYVGNQ